MASGALGNVSYQVLPHSPRDVPQARTHLLIGKRNTGKTTLLMDLLFHAQHRLQFGIIFAGSIGSLVELRKCHPDTFIYERFDAAVLEAFWKKVVATNGPLRRKGLPMVNFYIVLDDTGFDEKMWKSPVITEMLMNGRQYNLDSCVH